MSERTGDVMYGYVERWSGETVIRGYVIGTPEDLAAAHAKRKQERYRHTVESWEGDVIFDHITGARDVDTAPLCDPPYVLCWYTVSYEYTGGSSAGLHPKPDLAAALAEAADMVARAKSSGGYSDEVIEVYVMRVRVTEKEQP